MPCTSTHQAEQCVHVCVNTKFTNNGIFPSNIIRKKLIILIKFVFLFVNSISLKHECPARINDSFGVQLTVGSCQKDPRLFIKSNSLRYNYDHNTINRHVQCIGCD